MIITNRHGLPEPVINAIRRDPYSKGGADYTVTDLIRPTRITQLMKRHWHEIEEDAIDRLWVLLGQAVHAILERAGGDNVLQEERIRTEVLGRRISGAADIYHADGTIQDFKITSAWSSVFGSRIRDWEQQLNCYAHLFRTAGFPVVRLEAVCLYRDWSKTQIAKSSDYPREPMEKIQIPLWDESEAAAFFHGRVAELIHSETLADSELPECTSEMMWERPATWAVMKKGRISAVRVYTTEGQATALANTHNGYFVQARRGQRVRCERYCSVSQWCSQFREYEKENRETQP